MKTHIYTGLEKLASITVKHRPWYLKNGGLTETILIETRAIQRRIACIGESRKGPESLLTYTDITDHCGEHWIALRDSTGNYKSTSFTKLSQVC